MLCVLVGFTFFFVVLRYFLVSCFNWCLVVSTDLNIASGCSNCSLFEISLWYVPNCFILFFGGFRVVLGGVRWFSLR